MITLKREDIPPDQNRVESLVYAAATAMEKASIPDVTTPSELLSACFTLTSQTLYALRKLQDPKDAVFNCRAIREVLEGMMVDFGNLPN